MTANNFLSILIISKTFTQLRLITFDICSTCVLSQHIFKWARFAEEYSFVSVLTTDWNKMSNPLLLLVAQCHVRRGFNKRPLTIIFDFTGKRLNIFPSGHLLFRGSGTASNAIIQAFFLTHIKLFFNRGILLSVEHLAFCASRYAIRQIGNNCSIMGGVSYEKEKAEIRSEIYEKYINPLEQKNSIWYHLHGVDHFKCI